ncbi:hypothetical protein [Rhizobium leguminosarum]|uniref:Uncharacterized protein n=1 Tax=Rhizobium leguminosarum TaxID=384 RepID=A0A7K3VUB9_RHILE|nr:hypothetical protein [Rhizobium leguminosarum]NEK20726.1 hypothetical protein [Rhizobium leguminosarum]
MKNAIYNARINYTDLIGRQEVMLKYYYNSKSSVEQTVANGKLMGDGWQCSTKPPHAAPKLGGSWFIALDKSGPQTGKIEVVVWGQAIREEEKASTSLPDEDDEE